MVVATYNVRTLAVKERGGYGHAECVLAKARQLGYDFVGLQETRELGKQSSLPQDTEFLLPVGKKRKAGKDCMELIWQLRKRFAVSPFIPIL